MQQPIKDIVAAWFGGDSSLLEVCTDQPECAWVAVLEILQRNLSSDEEALLAAGPLENLLALHGGVFIDRVERAAASDPRFNYLLGGVWRSGIPEEIWNRIQAARREVW